MKRNAILVLILFFLLAGYYSLKAFPRNEEFIAPVSFVVDQWNRDTLASIKIKNGEESVNLALQNGEWTVNEKKVDAQRLSDLFDAFAEAEVTSRVSTNPQHHERFEVGESAKELVLSTENSEIQQLIVGKNAGGTSVYVRLPEDDAVYILSGVPAYLIDTNIELWRERKLLAVEPSDIRSVNFNGDWTLLNEGEGNWVVEGRRTNTSVDASKVIDWLGKLSSVQATEFIEDEPGRLISTIVVETGTPSTVVSTIELSIHRSEKDGMYHAVDEANEGYYITASNFDSIFVDEGDLLDELKIDVPVEPETLEE